MLHYQVRWSNSTLDWEAFPTLEEAQAEQLVRPGESYVIEQANGDGPRCGSLRNLAKSAFTSRDQRLPADRPQPNADFPKSRRASVSESESQVTRYGGVLQNSVETRMRAIQEKLSLAFTFCSTMEIEITHGHSDRAKELPHKLSSTMEALTDHINNPAHVSGKQRNEF
jgi:hypothetical protein